MEEIRYDPIRNRWVVVAPERARRPNDYVTKPSHKGGEKEKKDCPFCGGNEEKTPPEVFALRESGTEPNTPGWDVRVVPNKFPALRIENEIVRHAVGLFDVVGAVGAHEVIIETPEHKMNMADLEIEQILNVLKTYRERLKDLYKDKRLRYVLIFKNHRKEAGSSLEHTHSQLIATPIVPPVIKQELKTAREHYAGKERCIFCDMLEQEERIKTRVAWIDDHYTVLCPFASAFPFEMWILPRRHRHEFSLSTDGELMALSKILKGVLVVVRELLNDPPYNFVLHTAPPPFQRPGLPYYWHSIAYDYHWHIELIPRLTRIAGFEWGTGLYINPTPPEIAAEYLRDRMAQVFAKM